MNRAMMATASIVALLVCAPAQADEAPQRTVHYLGRSGDADVSVVLPAMKSARSNDDGSVDETKTDVLAAMRIQLNRGGPPIDTLVRFDCHGRIWGLDGKWRAFRDVPAGAAEALVEAAVCAPGGAR
jgi:hypothetical protein